MSRELLERAIDALQYHTQQTRPIHNTELMVDALREALAAPQPEPVGQVVTDIDGGNKRIAFWSNRALWETPNGTKVYATPPAV